MAVFSPVFSHFFHVFLGVKIKSSKSWSRANNGKSQEGQGIEHETALNSEKYFFTKSGLDSEVFILVRKCLILDYNFKMSCEIHSTCAVCGNISTGWMWFTSYFLLNVCIFLAKVDGLHET
jgi:hypothetical protein